MTTEMYSVGECISIPEETVDFATRSGLIHPVVSVAQWEAPGIATLGTRVFKYVVHLYQEYLAANAK